MASYADRFKKSEEQLPLAYAVLEPLRDICPSVREMFCGVYDDNGTEIVKSAGLNFFLDGSRLKFRICPKGGTEVGWGVVDDVRRPFESVQQALDKGEVDWKENKFSNQDSTIPY